MIRKPKRWRIRNSSQLDQMPIGDLAKIGSQGDLIPTGDWMVLDTRVNGEYSFIKQARRGEQKINARIITREQPRFDRLLGIIYVPRDSKHKTYTEDDEEHPEKKEILQTADTWRE